MVGSRALCSERRETCNAPIARSVQQRDDHANREKQSAVHAWPTWVQRCGVGSSCDCDVQHKLDGVLSDIQRATVDGGSSLPAPTRDHMENAFSVDFSAVRVHTGADANRLADGMRARAFTSGNDIVFRSSDYNPGTQIGDRLIAHELAHVVQQARGLTVATIDGGPTDPLEIVADAAAERAMRRAPAGAALKRGAPAGIQRQVPTPAPTPVSPTPPPVAPTPAVVCGPDVAVQVRDAVANTRSTFAGWSDSDKRSACGALISLHTGKITWDIMNLYNKAWISGYQPACSTPGTPPKCDLTVAIDGECSYAGSPNYVIFGVMFKLCSDHLTSVGSVGAAVFTEAEMLKLINWYKGTGPTGLKDPVGNFQPSREWSIAGYRGWPATSSPSGDRPTCAPACPTPYSGAPFRVNWIPMGVF